MTRFAFLNTTNYFFHLINKSIAMIIFKNLYRIFYYICALMF